MAFSKSTSQRIAPNPNPSKWPSSGLMLPINRAYGHPIGGLIGATLLPMGLYALPL